VTVEERFEKRENVMDRLAERTAALDEAMVNLAESAEEQYRKTQEQFRHTEEQFRQTDEQIRRLRVEAAERDLKTDHRFAALVSAIGALASRS
jgi:hypothetical protein